MAINWDVFLELNAVGAMRRMEVEREKNNLDAKDGGSLSITELKGEKDAR